MVETDELARNGETVQLAQLTAAVEQANAALRQLAGDGMRIDVAVLRSTANGATVYQIQVSAWKQVL